jgi:hypothetical protein
MFCKEYEVGVASLCELVSIHGSINNRLVSDEVLKNVIEDKAIMFIGDSASIIAVSNKVT